MREIKKFFNLTGVSEIEIAEFSINYDQFNQFCKYNNLFNKKKVL